MQNIFGYMICIFLIDFVRFFCIIRLLVSSIIGAYLGSQRNIAAHQGQNGIKVVSFAAGRHLIINAAIKILMI